MYLIKGIDISNPALSCALRNSTNSSYFLFKLDLTLRYNY